jgi:hypothetical protein
MSLPSKAVERLFDRLAMTYGNDWARRWDGLDLNAVKSLWAHELAAWADRLEDIAWALENLPPRAPNAIEFKQLCRQAPRPEVLALPEPKADPARLKVEMAKLREVMAAPRERQVNWEWARRIRSKKDAGAPVSSAAWAMASEVLQRQGEMA